MTITAWIFVLIVTAIVAFLSGTIVEHRLSVKRQEEKGGTIDFEKLALKHSYGAIKEANNRIQTEYKKLQCQLDGMTDARDRWFKESDRQENCANALKTRIKELEAALARAEGLNRAFVGVDMADPNRTDSNRVTVIRASKVGPKDQNDLISPKDWL